MNATTYSRILRFAGFALVTGVLFGAMVDANDNRAEQLAEARTPEAQQERAWDALQVELAKPGADAPRWTAADQAAFPACERNDRTLTDYVVVALENGERVRMGTVRAFELAFGQDPDGARVWIIGVCK